MNEYKRPTVRSANEAFRDSGKSLDFTLGDFWRWFASDLVSNALRGVLAEFLVARAVGCDDAECRLEWDACDLRTTSGIKIEVKASGYVQSWAQRQASVPSFSIGLKRGWDAATNAYATDIGRAADVYVFALHAHPDRTSIDPLDVAQWQFLVLRTAVLNECCPTQKRIGLGALRALGPREVSFQGLKAAVEAEAGLRQFSG